ncbi:Helix-turn-helix domain protein [Streptococcus parauberis]|uniref:helix-turn-helix domain-containing protein n=1 Tax=Streptococcus parauberis TaxID=1348 RepID=UPI000CCF4A58|nr:helix-turn-helix domain-containing protein [Streptococcus parauberis]PNY21187.1 Helix-turn-helix domain protein [Streptococcus parauberis]
MNRLKELRKNSGKTQKEVFEETGIPIRSIQNWENGKRQINLESAKQLADYFEVPIDYLLGYSEDNYIETIEVDNIEDLLKIQYNFGFENFKKTIGINSDKEVINLLVDKDDFEREFVKGITPDIIKKISTGEVNSKDFIDFMKHNGKSNFRNRLRNLMIAISYLDNEEEEILSLFYCLNYEEKKFLIDLARQLFDRKKSEL